MTLTPTLKWGLIVLACGRDVTHLPATAADSEVQGTHYASKCQQWTATNCALKHGKAKITVMCVFGVMCKFKVIRLTHLLNKDHNYSMKASLQLLLCFSKLNIDQWQHTGSGNNKKEGIGWLRGIITCLNLSSFIIAGISFFRWCQLSVSIETAEVLGSVHRGAKSSKRKRTQS